MLVALKQVEFVSNPVIRNSRKGVLWSQINARHFTAHFVVATDALDKSGVILTNFPQRVRRVLV
jgi:hypothetical protein